MVRFRSLTMCCSANKPVLVPHPPNFSRGGTKLGPWARRKSSSWFFLLIQRWGWGGGTRAPPLVPPLLLSVYIPRSHRKANFARVNLPPSVCVKSVLLINPRHPVLAYCTPISPEGPVVSLALNRSSVWLSSPVMK